MTENMAARGEGLAGLAKAILAYDDEFMTVLVRGRSVEQEKADYAWAAIIKQATLLEAAPAGTARDTASGTHVCPVCQNHQPHDHSELVEKGLPMALAIGSFSSLHSVAAILGKMREDYERAAALATPSPQAPDPRVQCMTCGAIFVEHARPCPKCGGKSIHHSVYNDHERATQEQPAGASVDLDASSRAPAVSREP